jgi:hypothetical protein
MTTSNVIETHVQKNALSIPLEAVTNEGTTKNVFKRKVGSLLKQEIETGAMNDNEIVVARGLEKGDEVLLATPPNAGELDVSHLDPAKRPAGGDTAQTRTVPTTAKR